MSFENSSKTEFVGLTLRKTSCEMRWAQGFGYGRAVTLLYGVLAPPGFWAFLIFGSPVSLWRCSHRRYTLKPISTPGIVKNRSNETRPLHLLLNNNKLICFIPEAKTSLGISGIARLLDLPAIGENTSDFENIPTLTANPCSSGLVTFANHSSIRHPSAFFQLVMQISKPASVAITRWLTREVIPRTALFKSSLSAVTNDTGLKKLIGRHETGKTGQVLIKLESVQAGGSSNNTDEVKNLSGEEEPCQKN